MKRKILSMLLASALMIGAVPVQMTATEMPEEVSGAEAVIETETTGDADDVIGNDENGIPNRKLYNRILSACDINGDGLLTKEEAKSLTTFQLTQGPWDFKYVIPDLNGIQYCENLTYLRIVFYEVCDISMLSSLTNLTHLDLTYNDINDISALSNLKNLNYLDLRNNPITDYSPLVGLEIETLLIDGELPAKPGDSTDTTDPGTSENPGTSSGSDDTTGSGSPTDSTEDASAVIDGETIEFPVNPDAEAGCTTDAQKSAFEIIMEMIRRLTGEVGEDATKIYAPVLQEYAKVEVKEVSLAECIDIQKPDGVDMSQGVAVTFPAKVKKGDTVIVLHLDEAGNWEKIEDAAVTADGWITGTFRSLSPVFYFKVETKAADIGGGEGNNGSGGGNTDGNTVNGGGEDHKVTDDTNVNDSVANSNTANNSYDGWAGVSAEQKAKLMQQSLGQKTAVIASPKTNDTNADINISVMLLLAAALCGAVLYGKKRHIRMMMQ